MYYLLVLALAVCAHGSEVPDYVSAFSYFKLSAETLEKHLLNNETNKEQVNYMVLMTSLGLVADAKVFLEMKYEQAYKLAVFLGEVVGRFYPDLVQGFAKNKLAKARRGTAKLMKIIQDNLSGSENPTEFCDEIVDAIVKKDEELKQEAALLLAISDLGFSYFVQDLKELTYAAKKDKVDEYLEKHKTKNKPLVEELAKVIELLFKKDNIHT